MAGGELWDALIEKYSDFERWDNSFADIRKLREAAFQKSMAEHVAAANRLRAPSSSACPAGIEDRFAAKSGGQDDSGAAG